MVVGGQCHALAALSLGKTQYPFYRRLGGPQAGLAMVQKIVCIPPPPPLRIVGSCHRTGLGALVNTTIPCSCWKHNCMLLATWNTTDMQMDSIVPYSCISFIHHHKYDLNTVDYHYYDRGRIVLSVQWLVTGWKSWGLNPTGGRDFLHVKTSFGPPHTMVPGVFPGGKAGGAWHWPPTPP